MGIAKLNCHKTMKQQLFFVFCLVSFGLSAQQKQDSNQNETDSIFVEKKKPFTKEIAGYFDQNFEYGPEQEGMSFSKQLGLGIFYEGFAAGFFISEGEGKTSTDPFFPRDYNLPYKHTGGFIGKSIHRGEKIQLYARMNVSYGDITWEDKETKKAIFEDRFYIIKPEMQVSYLPISFMQIYGSAGWRFTHQLDLTQLNPNDYHGPTFNIGIRLGYFYAPKEE